MELAERYLGASKAEASGWAAGTKRAADAYDNVKLEFTGKCVQRIGIVVEGLSRLRDALRSPSASRWIAAALSCAAVGAEFDSANPEAFAASQRHVFAQLSRARDAAIAHLAKGDTKGALAALTMQRDNPEWFDRALFDTHLTETPR